MMLIRIMGMGSFVFAVTLCIWVGVSPAEQGSGKPEDTAPGESGGWNITIGGTHSRPKLSRANRDIHTVESQLRGTAPTAKRFEDWDDVFKGTVGIGISKRVDIKGLKLLPEFYVAQGTGYVKTSQSNLNTIYAVPMNYRFKQKYEFYHLNLGIFAELFRRNGVSAILGGYLTYGLLGADTDFSTSLPSLGATRYVKGKFWEGALGYATMLNFSYKLPFQEKVVLSAAARYDWLKFKGPTKLDDYQSSPLGASLASYDQHCVSDMTGPSVFVGVTYRF